MARRPRRNHSGEFEARAALAALAPKRRIDALHLVHPFAGMRRMVLEALYPDGAYVAAQPRKQAA